MTRGWATASQNAYAGCACHGTHAAGPPAVAVFRGSKRRGGPPLDARARMRSVRAAAGGGARQTWQRRGYRQMAVTHSCVAAAASSRSVPQPRRPKRAAAVGPPDGQGAAPPPPCCLLVVGDKSNRHYCSTRPPQRQRARPRGTGAPAPAPAAVQCRQATPHKGLPLPAPPKTRPPRTLGRFMVYMCMLRISVMFSSYNSVGRVRL
jgi:hypothetical protein